LINEDIKLRLKRSASKEWFRITEPTSILKIVGRPSRPISIFFSRITASTQRETLKGESQEDLEINRPIKGSQNPWRPLFFKQLFLKVYVVILATRLPSLCQEG